MTGELLRPSVGYKAEANVLPDGVGVSLETTTWRNVNPDMSSERVWLSLSVGST